MVMVLRCASAAGRLAHRRYSSARPRQ
uniref:Uncharacterized protein n=1 Tax=Anopheles albimanus TaxID=7167 RepID=A0A182FXQ5_ANOAL